MGKDSSSQSSTMKDVVASIFIFKSFGPRQPQVTRYQFGGSGRASVGPRHAWRVGSHVVVDRCLVRLELEGRLAAGLVVAVGGVLADRLAVGRQRAAATGVAAAGAFGASCR